ncbi:MAG: PAS domain S-box protein [Haloferacaceae archaeon]
MRDTIESISVLHVDDEPELAEMTADMLSREDDRFEVVTATNATDGLDLFTQQEFDCVVSDYEMPRQNGIEFLEAVRETYPDLPFILYTGKGSEEIASDAIAAGATDYLQKGSGTDQYELLANRIRNAVAQYQSERSRQWLAELAENTDRVLFSFTADWERLLFVSSAYEDLWGRSIVDLHDDPTDFLNGIHPEDRDRVREAMGIVSDGEPVDIEFRIESEDRDDRWVRAHIEPIVNEAGSVIRVAGSVADITEEYRRRSRRKRQRETLVELATDRAVTSGDFETAVRRVTETAADVLDVPRVNIWLVNEDDGAERLTCVDHYDRRTDNHEHGMELLVEDHPAYLEALETHQAIDAADAREDPRTVELTDYLDTHDVGALLDATLRSEGDVVGVVCHEHVGEFREWTDDEIDFASDIADIVHRALRNHDRKQRERELEETRARFQALTRNATHAVVTINDESTVQYANDAVEDIFGYAPEELLNESLLTVMPERFHDSHGEAITRYLREGTKRLEWDWIELPGLHKDGHEVPLGISFGEATIEDERQFTALLRDITERKEREQALERTHELLQHTEHLADVGGWEIDTNTMDVFWTEHLFELLGVDDEEEPSVDEALDVYHEDDRPIVENAVEAALDFGESFDVEARYLRPDGEVRWLRVRGVPETEDGDVVALRGAVQDITDRRRRECVLRDMHDIISDRHQSFEEQVRALLELGRAELDTQYGTLSEIRDGDYVFEIMATDDDSIQAGDVVPVSATNCEIVASTEQTLVLEDVERDAPEETDRTGFNELGISSYIGAPVFVDQDVYGTFCFYDTGARTGQFSEWEKTLVDLMSRWVSYELQRRQANERLNEQNEQLEQFASIVSHDLRNPLNVAVGRLDLAMEECDSEHLDHVSQAHDRMRTLIDGLLQLALEGEELNETQQVDLRAFSEDCWRNVDTESATLVTDIDRTIGADESRFRQLFENLIRNSVDHGGSNVTVTVGELEDGFYVEDDGPGIPEGERDDVFEAGYSTNAEGTGFGLSIVKQVCDAHDWGIRVTKGSDGGARFEITGVAFVDR